MEDLGVTTSSDPVFAVKLAALKRIFRPASPIDDRELFRGRTRELVKVVSAVQELGQHAVVYGERGIGKTSLAYMARDSFRQASGGPSLAVRIPCSADDDFASVWKKLPPRLVAELDLLDQEDAEHLGDTIGRVSKLLEVENITSDVAARALHLVSSRVPLLVVLDEFDRIGDLGSPTLFADLIKTLSDDLVPCTLLIVGVADDVDGLITGHRSVERALRQIAMPRMSQGEIREIIVGGFETLEERSGVRIVLSPQVQSTIVQLAQGFPNYAHLMAGAAGEIAMVRNVTEVDMDVLALALSHALEEAQQSIRSSYAEAVASARTDARFSATLLACAMAKVDEVGFFCTRGRTRSTDEDCRKASRNLGFSSSP
jgi:Cdc6-like AAA superfamily ATPase